MRYVVYGPNPNDGGTSVLLGRLAEYLCRRGEAVRVVDLADGSISRRLRAAGLAFEHTLPSDVERFDGDELVIAILLHAKFLVRGFAPAPGTRFFFWCTHPHDAVKLLPLFNPLLSLDGAARRGAAVALHPRYVGRVRRFLEEAGSRAGLAFMDPVTESHTRSAFALQGPAVFLPVMTDSPSRLAVRGDELPTRVFWVGRLAHFKGPPVQTLLAALDAWVRAGHGAVTLDIVGDGECEAALRDAASRAAFPVRFHGAVPIAEVERLLCEDADLLVGHGVSILEGARLGVPCLVIDGWTFDVPAAALRLRWLQDEAPGGIGVLRSRPDQLQGLTLDEALAAWRAPGALRRLGEAARERWVHHHAVEAVGARAVAMFEANTFTWDVIRATGFPRLDLVGRVVAVAKRWYQQRRQP